MSGMTLLFDFQAMNARNRPTRPVSGHQLMQLRFGSNVDNTFPNSIRNFIHLRWTDNIVEVIYRRVKNVIEENNDVIFMEAQNAVQERRRSVTDQMFGLEEATLFQYYAEYTHCNLQCVTRGYSEIKEVLTNSRSGRSLFTTVCLQF